MLWVCSSVVLNVLRVKNVPFLHAYITLVQTTASQLFLRVFASSSMLPLVWVKVSFRSGPLFFLLTNDSKYH